MLRFRDLGASFSRFGCFVLRSSFSSASFSKLPATYRGLRPNGTTFYPSEIPLLLPPKFPGFFPKWKAPPGYQLSPNYFQKFKHMSPPDWTRNTCFVLLCPIGEQFLLSSFREFVHDGYGLGYCLSTLARFVLQACACKESFYFLLS